MLKRNNKFLAIGLAAVGAIGAASVGFATWFVGVQKTSVELNLSLLVDETQDSSFVLEAELNDNVIDIKDTKHITDGSKALVTTDAVDPNALSFSLKTLRYKEEVGFKKTVESFTFKLVAGEVNKISVTTDSGTKNNKIIDPTTKTDLYRTASQTLTYIDFAEKTITAAELGTITTNDGYKTYDVSKATGKLKFEWGTYFKTKEGSEGVSPATFYNDLYCEKNVDSYNGIKASLSEKFVKEQHIAIKDELEEMKTTLDQVKDLKLVVTANFAAQ